MRLVCPKCASQYEVDASLFPAEGREVQCSNCEETWTQYPEEEERAPVRLEAAAAAPARPSERLPEEEREELARAVSAERAVRDGAGTTQMPRSDSDEDEDIVAALREHIAAEGSDFESGPARSGRRDLRRAAENVGIEVADDGEEEAAAKRRRWNLSSLEDDEPAKGGRKRKEKQDGLARALRELEDSGPPRRGGGLKWGFRTVVVLTLVAAGVFAARGQIADAYPPAAPWLDRYAAAVDDARLQVEALYVEHGAPAVAEVTAMVAELTSGDEATAAE